MHLGAFQQTCSVGEGSAPEWSLSFSGSLEEGLGAGGKMQCDVLRKLHGKHHPPIIVALHPPFLFVWATIQMLHIRRGGLVVSSELLGFTQ